MWKCISWCEKLSDSKCTVKRWNHRQICSLPLHDIQFGVWCAVSATGIMRTVFYPGRKKNQESYTVKQFWNSFSKLMDDERWYNCFHQDGTVRRVMQLPLSPDLTPYDYCLSWYLDDLVYTNNIIARTTTINHKQLVSVLYQQEIVADSTNKTIPQVSILPECWR
jgi:hypothetical protein